MSDFQKLTDLAARRFGAGVMAANDEFFAEKENLLNAGRADFQAHTFGHKGQIYDGWETRRRRESGHDWAIVRLGAAGIIKGVVIDTGNFTGNCPEEASIEATALEGNPALDDLERAEWTTLVALSALKGDSENLFAINDAHRWTHLRLSIYPDGGVARLRVHGVVIPDPRWVLARGTIDLAALENGGELIGSSDDFYSSARNTLLPGSALTQGDGWENRRRRHGGNDWFAVALALPGKVVGIELDTAPFKGNAPGWISISAGSSLSAGLGALTLVSKTRVQPDTLHRYIIDDQTLVEAIRLDVYPDGGLGRFRVWGSPSESALRNLAHTWWKALPASQRGQIMLSGSLAEYIAGP